MGEADIAMSARVGHRTAMTGISVSNFLRSFFICAALALALSATTPVRAQDAPLGTELWKSSCNNHGCLLVGDVSHGDETAPRHMFIDVALQHGGKVESVTFRLPPDADKGKLFAVGFADSVKDASGNWTLKMVADATRILNIQDCSTACVVTLQNGIVAAQNNDPPFDLGQAMTTHNLMLTFYYSHGERIRASAALFRFKNALNGAMRRLP
jgi:hypothetical protein